MNKNVIRGWIVLGVLLVVYNVLVFALPFPMNSVFWLSWFFTILALGAQAYVIRVAFLKGDDVKSKFYGFPIARIGVAYLVVQFLLSLVFMALGRVVPFWLPLVLYIILLGAGVVGFVAADAVRDEIVRQDVRQEQKIYRMREFQSMGKTILSFNQMPQMTQMLEKLSDNLRFSDPTSNEALAGIENELGNCLEQLQQAVTEQDASKAEELCRKAERILLQRNQLCKQSK